MPKIITVKPITQAEIDSILLLEENWLIDMKGKDIKPGRLSKTISAFANNNGGEIYLGISCRNDKTTYYWDGFSNLEEANAHVAMIDTTLADFDYYHIDSYKNEMCGTIILHITIHKTRKIIYASDEKPYFRMNASNEPFDNADKIRRLELDKGISSYEEEFTQCTFEEVKSSRVLNSFIQQVVPSQTAYDWLRSQWVMSSDTKISVAGVLLYSELPQAILAKRSAVRILRYHTDEKEGSRENLDPKFPESIEGDIYSLIENTVKRVTSIVESTNVMGNQGMQTKEYPEVALHEIITNAVLHRDYSILGDIQIRIFTNRIEIESPGRLPGHITLENILKEQFSRNARIVRLISKFPIPPNKDAGEGLNTAFAAMIKMKLQRPIIKENDNSVLVIIKHERLADAEAIVLDYLQTNPMITNSIARELTGISDANKMKKVFYILRDKSLLERVPDKKSTASGWQLIKVKEHDFTDIPYEQLTL